MPVSPADFYAYSQATGVQVPDSPEERAQLAPQVLQFRRNQLKQPQEQGIDPVSMGVGIGLALAGAGAGALALRGRNRIPKSTKTTGQSGVKVEDLSRAANVGKSKEPTRQDVYQQVASKSVKDLPPVTRPLGGAETELIVDPNTGEKFAPGKSPYTETDRAQQLVNEYRQGIVDREINREDKVKKEIAAMKEGAAMRVIDELRAEANEENMAAKRQRIARNQQKEFDEARSYMSDVIESVIDEDIYETLPSSVINLAAKVQDPSLPLTTETVNNFNTWAQKTFANDPEVLSEINYNLERLPTNLLKQTSDLAAQVDEAAQNISQNALTDFQKRQAPAVSDQQINAVGSGEDQMTGRVRQQLQRNEDLNLMQVDALEDVNQQTAPASSDAPITQAAAQTVDGIPVDQAEGFVGPITAQETLELAKQDMIQRRQSLVEQGFQPGTVKFERALAQSFRTTANVQPRMTGETMQKTTLPAGPVRQTIQEVSASEYLPEYSVHNIGPEAKITQTAMGTAIRGASPVLEQQPPITRERQVFGTADVNVPGAPNEMMSDRPARETALSQILTEPQMRQDPYAVAMEEGGGPAGIGVYGIESSYVPGAQSKSTGMYSAAAQRKPTDVPYKEKKQGFAELDAQQLQNFIANAPEGRVREAGIKEQQRRETTKQSLGVSEAMRRARIEGRDPQAVLRGMGFGV